MMTAAPILKSQPLSPGKEEFTVLSLLSHRDILSYLVAIKSFHHFASPRHISIICDPSITARDCELLLSHIPFATLTPMATYTDNRIPTGGCWERLHALCIAAQYGYVVQLDSDTVTTNPIDEVANSVRLGRGFIMGIRPQQQLNSLGELYTATESMRARVNQMHVQHQIEYSLPRIGYQPDRSYTTGWAAFTGFPQEATLQEQLFDLAARLRALVGSSLEQWGSEMVAASFIAANTSGAFVLPFPKYCTPANGEDGIALHHFVGSFRFNGPRYARITQYALREVLQL